MVSEISGNVFHKSTKSARLRCIHTIDSNLIISYFCLKAVVFTYVSRPIRRGTFFNRNRVKKRSLGRHYRCVNFRHLVKRMGN